MTPRDLAERVAAPLLAATLAVYSALGAFDATPVAVAQSEGADEWATPLLKLLTLLALGAGWALWVQKPRWLRHRFGLWLLAAAAGSSLALLATQQLLGERWTMQYAPEQPFRIVVGTTLQPLATTGDNSAALCPAADARCHLVHWQGDARLAYAQSEAASRLLVLRALRVATYAASLLALLAVAASVLTPPGRSRDGAGPDAGAAAL